MRKGRGSGIRGSGATGTMMDQTARQDERVGDGPADSPGGSPRLGRSASLAHWAWEWTKSIFVALLLFFLVRTFVVEAFQIPTASMENTLLVGDFLLVNKMVYGAEIPGTELHLPPLDRPSRGDVVVFEPPAAAGQPPRTNYVKRIVGVPGDTLAMRAGFLYRNGARMPEPYVKRDDPSEDVRSPQFGWQRSYLVARPLNGRYRPTRDNWGPLVVPPDRFFVMGDNRANSEDSRYWGYVPRSAIKGRPLLIYYSYDRKLPSSVGWLTEIRWDRLLSRIR